MCHDPNLPAKANSSLCVSIPTLVFGCIVCFFFWVPFWTSWVGGALCIAGASIPMCCSKTASGFRAAFICTAVGCVVTAVSLIAHIGWLATLGRSFAVIGVWGVICILVELALLGCAIPFASLSAQAAQADFGAAQSQVAPAMGQGVIQASVVQAVAAPSTVQATATATAVAQPVDAVAQPVAATAVVAQPMA